MEPKVLQITLRHTVKAFSLLPAGIQLFDIAGLVAVVQTSSWLAGFLYHIVYNLACGSQVKILVFKSILVHILGLLILPKC